MTSRRIPFSPARIVVAELSRGSRRVPRCLMSARISVAAAQTAREAGPAPRIPWTAIFAKAWGIAARRDPVLRRFHASLPWPHLLEVDEPAACIVVEREHGGEAAVFFARFRAPDRTPLPDIATRLRRAKAEPGHDAVRRTLRLARIPWPLRPLALRLAMALARPLWRHAGHVAISALGAQRVAIQDSISVLPLFLSYGPIAPDGGVELYLSFDHRVMNGADGARAIGAIAAAIEGEVATELRALGFARGTATLHAAG